jgi:hypothetical protein
MTLGAGGWDAQTRAIRDDEGNAPEGIAVNRFLKAQ